MNVNQGTFYKVVSPKYTVKYLKFYNRIYSKCYNKLVKANKLKHPNIMYRAKATSRI